MTKASRKYISVTLSNDKTIQKLNKKYFKRDFPTDVLSFNINEKLNKSELYLGDIIVNQDQARHQAKSYNNSTEQEIADLVAHGVLHLLGVHHEDDNDHAVHGMKIQGGRPLRAKIV